MKDNEAAQVTALAGDESAAGKRPLAHALTNAGGIGPATAGGLQRMRSGCGVGHRRRRGGRQGLSSWGRGPTAPRAQWKPRAANYTSGISTQTLRRRNSRASSPALPPALSSSAPPPRPPAEGRPINMLTSLTLPPSKVSTKGPGGQMLRDGPSTRPPTPGLLQLPCPGGLAWVLCVAAGAATQPAGLLGGLSGGAASSSAPRPVTAPTPPCSRHGYRAVQSLHAPGEEHARHAEGSCAPEQDGWPGQPVCAGEGPLWATRPWPHPSPSLQAFSQISRAWE